MSTCHTPCNMMDRCIRPTSGSTGEGSEDDDKNQNVANQVSVHDGTSQYGKDFREILSGGGAGLTQMSVKVLGIKSRSESTDESNDEPTTGESATNAHAHIAKSANPIFPLWSQFTSIVHGMIQGFVVKVAVHAARNPYSYVFGVTTLSFALIAAGFFTNFAINTDEQVIYAPFKSRTMTHADWINNESGFPGNVRVFTVSMHANGENALGSDYLRQVFQVLDEAKAVPGYDEVCAQGDYVNFDGITTCKIASVTRFFKHDVDLFEKVYEEGGEEAVTEMISADTYENLTPVDTDMILGNYVKDEETGLITSVQSYQVFFFLANQDEDAALELEQRLVTKMATMQEDWDKDDSALTLEYFSMSSYSNEFARAIEKDLFLLPVVFFLMSGFTCLVFFRCDRVGSRSMLGIGSVLTIVLSLMSGFGLMFIIGVPFTSMTQILPFVIFGVGLDDTFIITGAYFRTDPDKAPDERIRETMEEVGLSISVTTITTMFAFILGCISTIPAIYWLNLYAFPTIALDFLFQITFFVALIVLDERRVKKNRMDCCVCITVKKNTAEGDAGVAPQRIRTKTPPERFMAWYARQLMRPWVKAVVIVGFLAYAGFCTYTTSLLTQEFDFADLLPGDSYVKDFLYSMETYTNRVLGVGIYFRGDFDQMDPDMQLQMTNYVDELSALPMFVDEPPFCWFRDFENFKNSSFAEGAGLENMTATEQIEYAFSIPAIDETYGKHVVRNASGAITASRCYTYLNKENVNLKVVKDQIAVLQAQRAVSARQPINQGKEDWSFFTYDTIYFIWEFYSVAVEELIFTTVAGVIAVVAAGFFFFPHWGAIFFVLPLISMLYINLLGTLQWAGLYINAVTYICLVISIGLMVDFIVHVLLRYYESKAKTREGKVIDTLETIGASILVGGLSTSLGVLPLALSTSSIMSTVFISFFAMIALGVTHGLVFLPVVLSICGPTGVMEYSSDDEFIADAGDLALKQVRDSDTDDSDSDSDKAVLHGVSNAPLDGVSDAPFDEVGCDATHSSVPSHHEVLHSSHTLREESLEVVRWYDTMAWI